MNKKIAIIGASPGQYKLCVKAKEMGVETHCFAWEKGAVCKDVVDHFYPISIKEEDAILQRCREIGVNGVVSNGSDKTSELVAYIAAELNLHGTSRASIQFTRNKTFTRQLANEVDGLTPLRFYDYAENVVPILPCVVKPVPGAGKRGVTFVSTIEQYHEAIEYAKAEPHTAILVEEFAGGREVSVESISFEGKHYVLQITDKDTTGAPHFLEIGHHQPSTISDIAKQRIYKIIPHLLDKIGYTNGPTHIEMKIDENDNIYLIEINARGGGDEISNQLVMLSTGYDYIKAMIEVALGTFKEPEIMGKGLYAGVYFLCAQTAHMIPFFKNALREKWMIESTMLLDAPLMQATKSVQRSGYMVYQSDKKITQF